MKIILISEKYPYGLREQFIDAEMAYCMEHHIELDIIPQDANPLTETRRELPSNVSLKSIGTISKLTLSCAKYALQALFSELFWREIANQKGSRMNKAKSAFKTLTKSLYIMDKLKTLYASDLRNKPNEIVFYTYWMKEAALAATLLKGQYHCKAVSRVHGFDLYLERHANSYLPFHKYVVRNLDAVYPVTEAGKTYLTDLYGNLDNVTVRYLGTDDCGVSPISSVDTYTIFSCSNVIPIKRVELIAEAIKLLDDTKLRWIHFGDGSSLTKVQDIIKDIRNSECVLAGRKTHQEVFDFYRNNHVDLFINVSTTEGLPVSIMEAMSFGIPAIATDVGGTYEIVQDGLNGRLIDSDINADKLACEIKRLMEKTQEEKLELRRHARRTWETKFSAEAAFSEFYNKLGV